MIVVILFDFFPLALFDPLCNIYALLSMHLVLSVGIYPVELIVFDNDIDTSVTTRL
jgi:hypothetical protein